MTRIGVILGSARPNRTGEQVATWVSDTASRRSHAGFELRDLRGSPLSHLDEPPAWFGRYQHQHTRAWADKIASFDWFVMVTPGSNHSTSGVRNNAIDYLHAEWNTKAVGFVSYGGVGGARAAHAAAAGLRGTADGRRAPAGRAVAADRVGELHHLQAGRPQRHRAGHAAGPGRRLEHARAAARRSRAAA